MSGRRPAYLHLRERIFFNKKRKKERVGGFGCNRGIFDPNERKKKTRNKGRVGQGCGTFGGVYEGETPHPTYKNTPFKRRELQQEK